MSDLYILIGVCYFPRNVHLCSLNIKYITIQATNQPKTNYDCALANRKPTFINIIKTCITYAPYFKTVKVSRIKTKVQHFNHSKVMNG